jgi:hypothetical protein
VLGIQVRTTASTHHTLQIKTIIIWKPFR